MGGNKAWVDMHCEKDEDDFVALKCLVWPADSFLGRDSVKEDGKYKGDPADVLLFRYDQAAPFGGTRAFVRRASIERGWKPGPPTRTGRKLALLVYAEDDLGWPAIPELQVEATSEDGAMLCPP